MKKGYKPKEWYSPYPKWAKSHRIIAEHWLIALFLFISLGILYTYLRVIILGPYAVKFQNFPDIGAFYPIAEDVALAENPKAQLAMIIVVERNYFDVYEMWDEKIGYITSFYYCSPDDEWTLQVDVVKDPKNYLKKGKVLAKREVPDYMQRHFLPDCSLHVIDKDPKSFKPTVEFLRKYISSYEIGNLEPVPRTMWMKSNNDIGVYWAAIFKYEYEDLVYGVMVDNAGNELKDEEEMKYPYSWQTGEFSDYP